MADFGNTLSFRVHDACFDLWQALALKDRPLHPRRTAD
jgi:hypothetical protein